MVWLYLFLGKCRSRELETKQGIGSREQDTRLWGRLVGLKQWSQCPPQPTSSLWPTPGDRLPLSFDQNQGHRDLLSTKVTPEKKEILSLLLEASTLKTNLSAHT